MLEVFTALFAVLFTLFTGAAIAGHVLLVQALLRPQPSRSRKPAAQPAMRGPMGVAVTGQ